VVACFLREIKVFYLVSYFSKITVKLIDWEGVQTHYILTCHPDAVAGLLICIVSTHCKTIFLI